MAKVGEGWGIGPYVFADNSERCIFEARSYLVLFCFQFNGAPTEGNYLQLFLAGRRIFSLGWRVLGRGCGEARRLLCEGVGRYIRISGNVYTDR
jgi:hypothetical protein